MSTLRERVEELLLEEGIEGEKAGLIASRIIAIGRSKGVTVVHQIGPNGFHRLGVNGEYTPWTSPTEIAKNGDFVATTDAFINLLPQVGKVFALKSEKDFTTESVQSLS